MKTAEDGTIIEFLLGIKPLEGVWFGQEHPLYPGEFWWRGRLREYASQFKTVEPKDGYNQCPKFQDVTCKCEDGCQMVEDEELEPDKRNQVFDSQVNHEFDSKLKAIDEGHNPLSDRKTTIYKVITNEKSVIKFENCSFEKSYSDSNFDLPHHEKCYLHNQIFAFHCDCVDKCKVDNLPYRQESTDSKDKLTF